MDEEEDVLVSNTDDESTAEIKSQCDPVNKSTRHIFTRFIHTKEIILYKLILILSTLHVLILLPLYIDTVNVNGDVYSLILTNTILCTIVLTLLAVALKFLRSKYRQINIFKITIKFSRLVQLSAIYFLSAVLITYALDRRRVVCHLQDPLKVLVLVLSFLYSFCFYQRLRCLKQIFSIAAIIVGIFIAIDYSMSNEFKCRGYERQHVSDDKGIWSWRTHAAWTSVYVIGLALYAAYFNMLEYTFANNRTMFPQENNSPLSLDTASSSTLTTNTCSPTANTSEEQLLQQKVNVLHLALWIHMLGTIIVIVLYISDFIPHIGKGSNGGMVFNYTINGILCHFSNSLYCNNLWIISWLFLSGYIIFVIASLKFLTLTQSAVYTVATITIALPLVQLWWSLFSVQPVTNGFITWNPSSGVELISTLLGLPIVIMGLFFLYKLHYKDSRHSESLSANE